MQDPKKDPDPDKKPTEEQDPDPKKIIPDPQHCLKVRAGVGNHTCTSISAFSRQTSLADFLHLILIIRRICCLVHPYISSCFQQLQMCRSTAGGRSCVIWWRCAAVFSTLSAASSSGHFRCCISGAACPVHYTFICSFSLLQNCQAMSTLAQKCGRLFPAVWRIRNAEDYSSSVADPDPFYLDLP